jgi:hypothetical protein
MRINSWVCLEPTRGLEEYVQWTVKKIPHPVSVFTRPIEQKIALSDRSTQSVCLLCTSRHLKIQRQISRLHKHRQAWLEQQCAGLVKKDKQYLRPTRRLVSSSFFSPFSVILGWAHTFGAVPKQGTRSATVNLWLRKTGNIQCVCRFESQCLLRTSPPQLPNTSKFPLSLHVWSVFTKNWRNQYNVGQVCFELRSEW